MTGNLSRKDHPEKRQRLLLSCSRSREVFMISKRVDLSLVRIPEDPAESRLTPVLDLARFIHVLSRLLLCIHPQSRARFRLPAVRAALLPLNTDRNGDPFQKLPINTAQRQSLFRTLRMDPSRPPRRDPCSQIRTSPQGTRANALLRDATCSAVRFPTIYSRLIQPPRGDTNRQIWEIGEFHHV
jgi:hypothetical protein